MSHSDFAKDTAVARTPGRDEHATSPSTKSHTSNKSRVIEDIETEDDRASISSASTHSDSINSVADQRPSIHHTWSRNTGHSWPGDKEDAITTVTTNATQDPRFEVDYEEGEDPEEWPMLRKALVVFFMSFSTLVVVMYSTSYTSGIPGMMETFGIRSKTLVILGITTYLCGLAIGSLLLAPLSEMYGRRPVYLIAVALFTVLIIPCALSNNLAQILVMRFFGAIAGAAMISNAPGTVSDISKEDYRALAFSIWSLVSTLLTLLLSKSNHNLGANEWSSYWASHWRIRLPSPGLAMDKLGCHDRLWYILVHGLHDPRNIQTSNPSRQVSKQAQGNLRFTIPLALR